MILGSFKKANLGASAVRLKIAKLCDMYLVLIFVSLLNQLISLPKVLYNKNKMRSFSDDRFERQNKIRKSHMYKLMLDEQIK